MEFIKPWYNRAGLRWLGVFHLDRGDILSATRYFERAVAWDTNSAPSYHALAVALSLQGRNDEAVQELQIACRLAPRDAELKFKLGLALNEVGKLDQARAALEEAVKLDPQFAQALGTIDFSTAKLSDFSLLLAQLDAGLRPLSA